MRLESPKALDQLMRSKRKLVPLLALVLTMGSAYPGKRVCVTLPVPFKTTANKTTPFGFDFSMTRAEAISAAGKSSILRDTETTLELSSAPLPDRAFETYSLSFSSASGLRKIEAIGKDIETNGDGTELRWAYLQAEKTLVKFYGKPKRTAHTLKAGSFWSERGDFMMGLSTKERSLESVWLFANRADHIAAIRLYGIATSRKLGRLNVRFEF